MGIGPLEILRYGHVYPLRARASRSGIGFVGRQVDSAAIDGLLFPVHKNTRSYVETKAPK